MENKFKKDDKIFIEARFVGESMEYDGICIVKVRMTSNEVSPGIELLVDQSIIKKYDNEYDIK